MFSIDTRELAELDDFLNLAAKKNERAAQETIDKCGFVIERNVKAQAKYHRKTGATLRTIRFHRGKLEGSVYSTSKIARFLEAGTRARTIVAKNKKVLRFVKGGVVYFRRSVSHPGSEAYKIFEIGLANSRMDIDRMLKNAYRSI